MDAEVVLSAPAEDAVTSDGSMLIGEEHPALRANKMYGLRIVPLEPSHAIVKVGVAHVECPGVIVEHVVAESPGVAERLSGSKREFGCEGEYGAAR